MARFSGKLGFGIRAQAVPGVWSDTIVERAYKGDILRDQPTQAETDQVNSNIRLEERISIVADAFAVEHVLDIKYVRRAGVPWSVVSAEIKHPRLVLTVGGAYHGKLPSPTP